MQKRTSTLQMHDAALLEAAIAIGDRLISPDAKNVVYDDAGIYSGSSGVALFLLELYKQTSQQRYLQAARAAVEQASALEKEKTEHIDRAFITGRLGVAYTWLKFHEVTNKQSDLRRALSLAKTCQHPAGGLNEYIGGNAGVLLAFLHLYAASKEPWTLQAAHEYAEYITQHTRQATTGVYWDRWAAQIQPLCGFSHGVSGIGFVFLELGRYLKKPAYYTFAKQAFSYENACFNEAMKNWPDYRLRMWEPEQVVAFEIAFKQHKLEAFTRPTNVAAWCHGAPGIGLTRILAYRLTKDHIYLRDLNRALLATHTTHIHDLSLCHGQAGNLELFIESYTMLGRKRQWTEAVAAGKQLLHDWKAADDRAHSNSSSADQEDMSLFTGLAGVGYTFLRLYDPFATPSILAPHLPAFPGRPDSKVFPHIRRAEVEARLAAEDAVGDPSLLQLKRQMRMRSPSNGLLFIKRRVRSQTAAELSRLSDEALLSRPLRLDENTVFHMSKGQYWLLRYTVQGIEENRISQFCYIVLEAFKELRSTQEVTDLASKRYGLTEPRQRELLQIKALEQVRQALGALLLFPADSPGYM